MDLALRGKSIFPIHEIYANVILRENGVLNGKYIKKVGWKDDLSKESIIKKIIQEKDKKLPIIAFGDTSGDYPLINNASLSFSCFSSDSGLNTNATHIIDDNQNFYTVPKLVKKFLKIE